MSARPLSSVCFASAALVAVASALGLVLLPPLVTAAQGAPGPINITSERMEADAAGDVVTFSGNVVATQAEGMLKAQRVRVFYRDLPATEGSAAAGEPEREITRIEANGEVTVVQGDKVATGQQAVYSAQERTVILTGEPRVRQDRDWVRGTRVTIYLDEDRSVVEGGPGERVESVLYPRGERPGKPQP